MYGQMNSYNPYLSVYSNQLNNQLQNNQISSSIASHSIIRVNGIDGAKAFSMQPNSTVALFDENNDRFYLKTTDGAGFPTIRIFTFSEVKKEETPTTEYVTKDEFNELKEAIANGKFNIQQSTENKRTNSKQSKVNNE